MDLPSSDAASACSYGSGAWELGEVEHLVEISSSAWEGNCWLSSDGLTMYFGSNRAGGMGGSDIWQTTRPSRMSPFLPPTNFGAISTPQNEDCFAVTDDGLYAVFTSNRDEPGSFSRLYEATRETPQQPWTSALFAVAPYLNLEKNLLDLELTGDGLRLYYSTIIGSSQDLFMAQRASRALAFSPGIPLVEVNSTAAEGDPTFAHGERVIVFSSNRPGGPGGLDLWFTVREDIGSPFSEPALVPGINTSLNENEPYLSPDGCELIFSSPREGQLGSSDFYRVRVIAGP